MIQSKFGGYKALAAVCLAGMLCLLNHPVIGQEKQTSDAPATAPSVWMKRKLEYSRNILAGLANEDFDMVADNARAMQFMSKFEGFLRGKMPGYRTQLQIFQNANEEIIEQAQKDNVEGATLAFSQLTVSCVNCHKQLRAQDKRE